MKKFLNPIIYIIAFVIIVSGLVWYAQQPRIIEEKIGALPKHEKLKVTKDKILDRKNGDVNIFNPVTKESRLSTESLYAYITDKEVKNEIIFKEGNIYSNTEKLKDGTLKCYTAYKFYKDKDKVFEVDTATTTPEAFDLQVTKEDASRFIGGFFPRTASADTFTITTDNGINGYFTSNWSAAYNLATGSALSGTPAYAMAQKAAGTYYLGAGFLRFDTSAIGAGATIGTSSLYVYSDCGGGGCNTASYAYNVYGATTDFSNPIATADWTKRLFATTSFSTNNTNFNTDQWREWVLNSSGTSSISTTGNTNFTIRNVLYDAGSSTPPDNGDYIRYQTNAGANDPYLIVNFTEGGGEPEPTPVPNENMIIFE